MANFTNSAMAYRAVCLFVLLNVVFCGNLEHFKIACSLVTLLVGGIFHASYGPDLWYGQECCSDKWINLTIEGLQSDIQQNVYGQHLMHNIVLQTLNAHMKTMPRKALVLSFHGPTGTGKNLVTSFITKNLFKKGPKSRYVHLYIGTKDLHDAKLKTQYMAKLKKDVEDATRECGRNLFVFDEVDKMVPGVLDALSPYIDFHDHLNGVDYRRNVFIFLSNAGARNITRLAWESMENGVKREDICFKEFERAASRGAYHEIGGLYNSEIVKKGRIDMYIPFLPLEKEHVKRCIYAELRSMKWMASEDLVNKIAEDLEYFPEGTDTYSASGCRLINSRVKLFAETFKFK